MQHQLIQSVYIFLISSLYITISINFFDSPILNTADIQIDFDQDVHANEHARPSPVGESLRSRAQIQEDFHIPIALDANAKGCFFYYHNIIEVTSY